jgi:hypothetical protein
MPRVLRALVAPLLLSMSLWASAAQAHDADVVYVKLESGPNGSLLEVVTLTNATLVQLAPVDADGDGVLTQADLDARAEALRAGVWNDMPLSAGGQACPREAETATLEEGFISLAARFSCGPGDLRQDFKVLRILPSNYRVVLGSQLDGERGRKFAQGVFTALEVPRPFAPALLDGGRLAQGFERGVRDAGVVEALALLLLLWLSVVGPRALSGRVAWVLLGGALIVAGLRADRLAPVLMAVGVVTGLWSSSSTLARRMTSIGAVAAGLGLSLRTSTLRFSDSLGWWLGLVAVAVCSAMLAWPLGGLLSRRPRVAFGVRLGLAAMVLVAVGLRLS